MKGYIAKVKHRYLVFVQHKVTANESDFAPDTLVGKTLEITEATNNGEFKTEFYFRSDKAYFMKYHHPIVLKRSPTFMIRVQIVLQMLPSRCLVGMRVMSFMK